MKKYLVLVLSVALVIPVSRLNAQPRAITVDRRDNFCIAKKRKLLRIGPDAGSAFVSENIASGIFVPLRKGHSGSDKALN